MYIAAYVFRRVPGMELSAFLDYYERQHGPRMVELMRDKGLIAYVHYPVRELTAGDIYVPDAGPAYDALSIYTFTSAEAAREAWLLPEVVEDSKNFIDFDSMAMLPLSKRDVYPCSVPS